MWGASIMGGSSAAVELWIEDVHGTRIPLSQVGPHFVIAREATAMPAKGTVVVSVDGNELRHDVAVHRPLTPVRKYFTRDE